MTRSGLSIGLVWASWLVILLLELATPTHVVIGILYVIPLVIGAAQRTSQQAWRFLSLCCAALVLNLFVPAPAAIHVSQDLANRLLVCLCLTITTLLLIRNQALEQQRIALDVQLAQAQLRGDVIATLAHDLKTPILGTLAAIASLDSNPALAAIRASQQRCLRLIDDLLQVFRAEQEGLKPKLADCNLLGIAQDALQTVEPIATQRQISVVLRQGGQVDQHLVADATLLQRLIENLLLNALHHSSRGQRIWLQLSRAEAAWRLEIRDEGQGFRSGELPGLFQRFSPVSSDRPGAGLGLYLCRLIAEAHDGTIKAGNCPGGGARVVVQLPLLRA
jgi:two-component system NarL family sensor kinase